MNGLDWSCQLKKKSKEPSVTEIGSNTRGEVSLQVGKYIYKYLFPSLGTYSKTKIRHSYPYTFKGNFLKRRIIKYSILKACLIFLIERREVNGNLP